MKKLNKNGFTIYSLVIAIAALAIVSAVIIPTFAGVVNKADENNYCQAKTAQQMVDIVAELDVDNLLTWDAFETSVVNAVSGITVLTSENVESVLADPLNEYFKAVNAGTTLLTEDQVKLIILHTLSESFKDAQVETIYLNVANAVR